VTNVFAGEVYWPASPRIPGKVKETWVEFDNVRTKNCLLYLGNTRLDVPYIGGFVLGENNPRWNITFVNPEQPLIRIGFTSFDRGAFLPDATPASVKDYIKNLKTLGAKDIQSTATGELSKNLFICGQEPEVLLYSIKGIRNIDYFLSDANTLFIFSFEAPEKVFDGQQEEARVIFSRMKIL
jgi:hypothetical protein